MLVSSPCLPPSTIRLSANKHSFAQVPGLHLPDTTVGAESQSVGDPKSFATNPKDKGTWDAQLFRSITSTSAAGLSVAHNKVANMGLTAGRTFYSFQREIWHSSIA